MNTTNISSKKIELNTIEDAIQDIKKGKIIIVVDDENMLDINLFHPYLW